MSGIRLDPEHGVNPTLVVCWWCGKETGDLALLGRLAQTARREIGEGRDGGRAPKRTCLDREPCDNCKACMTRGVTLIEATGDEHDPEPTGRWWVLTDQGWARLKAKIEPAELGESIEQAGRAHLPPDAVKMLGLDEIEPMERV